MSGARHARVDGRHSQSRRAIVRVSSVTYLGPNGESCTATPDPELGAAFAPAGAVRGIPHSVDIDHTPGSYYSSTDGVLLDYESWLEARWLQLLDQDPEITAIYTQPITIRGIDEHGPLTHDVDIFARRADGAGLLIEVKAARRRDCLKTVRRACLARAAADAMGWSFFLVSDPPVERARNVAWLSGYRRLHGGHHLIEDVLAFASRPVELRQLWARFDSPELAKTVTFHLLWTHRLGIDLDSRLSEQSLVWRSS